MSWGPLIKFRQKYSPMAFDEHKSNLGNMRFDKHNPEIRVYLEQAMRNPHQKPPP